MTVPTVTRRYTAAQCALAAAADDVQLKPYDVRVLLAAVEHPGSTSADLADLLALAPEGSSVRRSLAALRRAGLVTPAAPVAATEDGHALAARALAEYDRRAAP